MKIAKRITLFLLVNILVIFTISTVTSLLGLRHYITSAGLDYSALLVFCLIWGFSGSLISLGLSRVMAKWMMGVQVIDPRTTNHEHATLVNTVHELSRSAGLSKMPEVGIYESQEVNAFATGPTKNRSLVACSTGLLRRMDRNQVRGVLGHEVAHIANGDMVTMTLIQGVVNAFTMFLARVISFAISQHVKEESRAMTQMLITIGLDIVFSILGSIVVCSFSRAREFRADAGSAKIAGRESMISALKALTNLHSLNTVEEEHKSLATLKISGGRSWLAVFSTHPPLEERIKRLERI